uniref:Uncharacterized protein n=1 Tax=Fagus sylvatica TaxID=28930 RepID=A0A2N9EQZ1_FAGSY
MQIYKGSIKFHSQKGFIHKCTKDASRETESFSLQKEERVYKTPSCRGARLALIAIVRPYPSVGSFRPFSGSFAALRGLSPDRCGFVLVLGEIFNSKGCLVGGGHGSSSHLKLILTIPLTIWG